MARLVLRLFGGLEATLDGALITTFESAKVRALLAYLAAEYARSHNRERLAALLWPDWPQQSAMRNLRNALADLRQNIGDREAHPPFLLITRETIQLNRESDVWVDMGEFEAKISDQGSTNGDLQSAISLYRGLFLEGFSLPDSPPFEEWLLAKREYFSQQMLKTLSRLAEWSLEQEDYGQAESYARRQIELEPWREQAHQQLMRALSLKGERVQALAQFESLKKALQRELKVEPSEDTLQLYQQIREGALQARKKAAAVAVEIPARLEVEKPHHNLPLQLTSFIGREKDIDAVAHLLQTARLVTLTGPGGTGKTRLALQTAAGLVEQFADGVWLVELAPLSDPTLVPALAARALGLRELTGPQVVELLQDYLEKQQVLLILDNCEHVIEACARLAEALLQTCPKLTFLASSREALGIPGEMPFRVPPLALPEAAQSLPFDELAQYEAIQLFVDRAATASTGFTLTPANASAILQVCQRLDGIPLAIELAAARVRMLQVDEIAQRLDDRFRLLTGGSRAALPRYQTLRASIDWSYDLLTEAERTLLQRLSVFAGGWILEAAEAVGCGQDIQACDVLELLGHLVDKSLIQTVSSADGLSRFRMLETIRQYAHEKLVEAGQAEVVRHRHLQYYMELAEEVEWKLRGPDPVPTRERLDSELENLRLALAWSLEGKGRPGWNPEPGLRLVAALDHYWLIGGHPDEGIQWLELLLAGEVEERGTRPLTPERTRRRAKALQVISVLVYLSNEHTKAGKLSAECRELYQSLGADGKIGYAYACTRFVPLGNPAEEVRIREQALAILLEAGDRFGVGKILASKGIIALSCNEYEKAQAFFDENLALVKEIGDLDGLAGTLVEQSNLAYFKGEFKLARKWLKESMGIYSAIHYDYILGWIYLWLSQIEMVDGNYAQAVAYAREALSTGHRQGDIALIQFGLYYLGRMDLIQGKTPEAAEWFEQNLAYCRKKSHKAWIAYALYSLGLLAWEQGKCDQASTLYTEALINFQESGNKLLEGFTLYHLAKATFAQGEIRQALANFKQAFETPFMWLGNPLLFRNVDLTMLALEGMAALAAAQGQYEAAAHSSSGAAHHSSVARSLSAAARLLGATEAWHQRFFYARLPRERQEREACIAALRAGMGEQAFAAAWAEGQAMTQEQAVAYALEEVG
jgi:predicted ATPase/DNA-binding SARP family transcriptional activator